MKNFNAVSHNRARPYFQIQHGLGEVRARRVYLNVHSVTGNVVDKEWSVEFCRWKCCRECENNTSAMLNSKIRPRAIVGYGVKIFLPSPPNYVTRSPGWHHLDRAYLETENASENWHSDCYHFSSHQSSFGFEFVVDVSILKSAKEANLEDLHITVFQCSNPYVSVLYKQVQSLSASEIIGK